MILIFTETLHKFHTTQYVSFKRDFKLSPRSRCVCAPLGYYAAFSSNSLPTLRNNLWVPIFKVQGGPWRWGGDLKI